MKRRRFLQLAASAAAASGGPALFCPVLFRRTNLSPRSRRRTVVSSGRAARWPLFDASHVGCGAGRRSAVGPDQMIEMLLRKDSAMASINGPSMDDPTRRKLCFCSRAGDIDCV